MLKAIKIWYDERGSKIAEGVLVNNLANGYWKYYKYGFLNSEGLYNNGLKEGKWTSYYESYFYQITIDDKNKDVVYDLLNGKNPFFRRISTIVNYQKGKKNGEYINYHFSGKIKYLSAYKENQLNGTSIGYGKNERPESIHSYKNDKLEGMWISFFEGGTIELLCYYKEGKQFGDWDLFNEEGKILCSSKNGDAFPELNKGRYYCKRI